jgi:ELWxxDGT repeat protein
MPTEILFEATDSSYGSGLWVTDGTAAGTSEIIGGTLSPAYLVSYGNEVLFDGEDASGNFGLWMTDGSASGTTELAVQNVGTDIGLAPENLTPFGAGVYFSGIDASGNFGLWVTNGTVDGTTELVATSGTYALDPTNLTVVNTATGAVLAFDGVDAQGNYGLWLSDGTAAGTSEIYAGSVEQGGVSPSEITPLNGTEFVFTGFDDAGNAELFVSNGTSLGTSELAVPTAPPGIDGDFVYTGGNMAALGGHVLFAAYDSADTNLIELWSTDGTAAGTTELVVQNANTFFGLVPTDLTTLGSLVVFDGIDAAGNSGLWVTDGTAAGTTELTGIANAGTNFDPADLTTVGQEVYFNAIDSNGNTGLWMTDGTAAGTTELTPISGEALDGFDPNSFAALVPCFATGTRIRTLRGDVAVEDLAVGQMAVTHDGQAAPIRWIGTRKVGSASHPAPASLWPVRVAAGAFGCGLPTRDLLLSPDHAVFSDGVLIPVRYLVNGDSVAQVRVASVSYWHVELDRHAVLLAEGLAVESYLETGQRAAFANGGAAMRLHPDFAVRVREAEACAPIVVTGPVVAAVRARLLPFATAQAA